jgi:hypothetical protein
MKQITLIVLGITIWFRAAGQLAEPKLPEVDGVVKAMANSNDTLFFAGSFNRVFPPALTGKYGAAINAQTGNLIEDGARPNGKVNIALPDGTGGFYVAGLFTLVGDSLRSNLVQIDSMGKVKARFIGFSFNAEVNLLLLKGDTLFVGGIFNQVNNIPRSQLCAIGLSSNKLLNWNPAADNIITSIAVHNGFLFAGGNFTQIGGKPRKYIACIRLDDTGTATLWNPNPDGRVLTIAVAGETVYAGGYFYKVGGQSRSYIAAINALDTGTLLPWYPSPDHHVYSITIELSSTQRISRMFVGGAFGIIGGWVRNRIAALDSNGAATSFDPNANNRVDKIVLQGNSVYAFGPFSGIDGKAAPGMAKLNSVSGKAEAFPLPYINSNSINTYALGGSTNYFGGSFTRIGGIPRKNLAAYNITTGAIIESWRMPIAQNVYSMLLHENKLFVAGDIVLTIDIHSLQQVSLIESKSGSYQFKCLAFDNNILYVGGTFTELKNGPKQNCIAAFNLKTNKFTSWNPNLTGFSPSVNVISIDGNNAFIGGNFNNFSGMVRTNIACIDLTTGVPTSWAPNPNAYVFAIAPDSTRVYFGGQFTSVGLTNMNFIACADKAGSGAVMPWNPSLQWSHVPGEESGVHNLLLSDSFIFACGAFRLIGSQTRNSFAKISLATGIVSTWNAGVSYTGGDAYVAQMLAANDYLFVGGKFDYIRGTPRQNLAAIYLNSVSDSLATLTLSNNLLQYTSNGGTNNLGVFSNSNWTATASQPWVSVSVAIGFGNQVPAIVAAASEGSAREAWVEFTTGQITRSVKIVQDAEPTMVSSIKPDSNPFNIFPNPGNGIVYLNISARNATKLYDITVINQLGETVVQTTWETAKQEQVIMLNHLRQGIYFFIVRSNEGQTYLKKYVLLR